MTREHVKELQVFMQRQRERLDAAKKRKQVELHVDIADFAILLQTAEAAVNALANRAEVQP